MNELKSLPNKYIILFDGVCNLCNASVNFIIQRDKKDLFRFAAFQSDAGQEIVKGLSIENIVSETLVLYKEGEVYTQSTAALIVARKLAGLWPLLYPIIIIPKPIRDSIYGIISKNRYKWFGRREECVIPSEELIGKYL